VPPPAIAFTAPDRKPDVKSRKIMAMVMRQRSRYLEAKS
jgi:hypothetical protein